MTQFTIVNVVPQSHSNETWQDSEPSIGVNQADPTHIVLSAFTPADLGQTNGPVYYSEDGGASWDLSFIVPGGEPQREMAMRFGINLVMYVLTGNYKSDQVHVPAILERLGQ